MFPEPREEKEQKKKLKNMLNNDLYRYFKAPETIKIPYLKSCS